VSWLLLGVNIDEYKRMLTMRRLTKRYRLGDIIKSPYIGSYELIVAIDYNVEPTYHTMYIDGYADGLNSHTVMTMDIMQQLDYELIYNVFDKRRKNGHRIQREED
jgi:hypothetical protein